MKAYLTEWLIRYGTGWGEENASNDTERTAWVGAKRNNYLEYKARGLLGDYRITLKGLKFIGETEDVTSE